MPFDTDPEPESAFLAEYRSGYETLLGTVNIHNDREIASPG